MGNAASSAWFTDTINQKRVYRFDWGIYVFTLLYTIIFLYQTIKKLWWTKPEHKIYKSIRFLSTIHSVFYLAYFILFWPDKKVSNSAPNRISSYVMLMLAQLSFYMLMTLRLYQTFTATIYALSNTKLYCFIILNISLLLTWIVWFLQIWYINQAPDSREFKIFNRVVLSLMLGLSCLYGFSLIWSFVHKLFQLTLSQRRSIHIFNEKRITSSLSFSSLKGVSNSYMDKFSFSQSKSRSKYRSPKSKEYLRNSIELNAKQKSLVDAMIKNSFLGIIAIVLYQCLFVIGPIIITDYRMEVMYKFIFALAIFFEMLCIYLSFKTNDSFYKCLCGKCHNCCEKWCENIVEKKIQKLNEQTLEFLDTTNVLLEEVSLSNITDSSLNNMSLNDDTFVK